MKQKLRYVLGKMLQLLGTTNLIHELYLFLARKYLRKSLLHVKAAWARRSLTSVDFMPLVSDIDLTVVIPVSAVAALMQSQSLAPRHLICDVQIVAEEFYDDWVITGGFRNRQAPAWINLMSSKRVAPPVSSDRHELAFELANEVFLLYSQLAVKLTSGEQHAVRKLGLELERLFDYWQSQVPELIFVPREKFFSEDLDSDFVRFLSRQEKFWGELLAHLQSPMGEYNLEALENQKDSPGSTLFLEISSRPVFLLKDFTRLSEVLKERSAFFIATPNFVRLLKGVGIQEQELLNQVAAKSSGYYRQFCRQRLAHDLIGTLLQDPDNQRRLYFCFKNNHEFLKSLNLEAPGWSELHGLPEGKIPWKRDDLLDVGLRNLEVLRRVR